MPSPKIWFITGASSGFGLYMTELVLKNGDIAIATLRRPEVLADLVAAHSADKLLVLKLDVCKPQEIRDAFTAAEKRFGRIDVVFNNAGYSILGEVETTPEDVARAMFDVNFWGAVNVSKEAVRFFREVNKPAGGRLLQNSSMLGLQGRPAVGFYSASKHALEGFTQSLAAELDPEWNIKVTLISPGGFKTKGIDKIVHLPSHPAYTKPTSPVMALRRYLEGDTSVTRDARKGVAAMYALAALADPPLDFPLGKDAVAAVRSRTAQLIADTDAYESIQEGLEG